MALMSDKVPENEVTFILTWLDGVNINMDLIVSAYDNFNQELECSVGVFNPRCYGVKMSRDHLLDRPDSLLDFKNNKNKQAENSFSGNL
jgi:hypothetical protein